MMYWIHPDHPDAHRIFYSHLRQLTTRYNKKKAPLALLFKSGVPLPWK